MYDSPQVREDNLDRLSMMEGVLSCSKARYYNPNIGRFVSEDPLRVITGPSDYSYVRNLPTILSDPSGRVFVNIEQVGTVASSPNQTRQICGAASCFDALLKKDCVCVKDCIFWKPKLSLHLISTIYYFNIPTFVYLTSNSGRIFSPGEAYAHEMGHYELARNTVLDLAQRGELLENGAWFSEEACNASACSKWTSIIDYIWKADLKKQDAYDKATH